MTRLTRWLKRTESFWAAVVGSKVAEHSKRSRLRGMVPLEDRVVPIANPAFSVGAGVGDRPTVHLFDAAGGTIQSLDAYEPSFTGGVRSALADLSGDGVPDLITAAGPGGGPRVRAFDGVTGEVFLDFFAYDDSFRCGVMVAAGSLGGGRMGIVTGADEGGGPHVRVFDSTGQPIQNLFAFDPDFRGGVRVALGTTQTGRPAVVAASGPGMEATVNVIDLQTGNVANTIHPYSNFTGGVFVTATEVTDDEVADLITAPGMGGGPHVRVFDGTSGLVVSEFMAGDPDGRRGTSVTTRERNGVAVLGAGTEWYDENGVATIVGLAPIDSEVVAYSRPLWEYPSVRVEAVAPTDPVAGGVAGFRVWRSGSAGDLELNYSLTGTAVPGSDFIAPSGSVKITSGNRGVAIPFRLTAESSADGSESLGLRLLPSDRYRVVTKESREVPLTVAPPEVRTLTVNTDGKRFGSGKTASFTLTRTDTRGPLTVNYLVGGSAVPGKDYVPLSGSVTFPAGVATVNVPVRPVAGGDFDTSVIITAGELTATVFGELVGAGVSTFAIGGGGEDENDYFDGDLDDETEACNDESPDVGEGDSNGIEYSSDDWAIVGPLYGSLFDEVEDSKRNGVQTMEFRPDRDGHVGAETLPYREPFSGFRADGSYVPPQPQVQLAGSQNVGLGSGPSFSSNPVRYSDGVVSFSETDFAVDAGGLPWGSARNWSNDEIYSQKGFGGNGWNDSYLPFLLRDTNETTFAAIFNGTQARLFDSGIERHDRGGTLFLSSFYPTEQYKLTTASGVVIEFYGFNSSIPAKQRGTFFRYTDPAGNVVEVQGHNSNGTPTEVRRVAGGVTESIVYSYLTTGDNTGRMSSQTLRRQVTGGSWETLRVSEYAYYDGAESHGSLGDLKTVTLKNASGAVIDQSYYRYYVASEANGFEGGLKYAFKPDSFRRLANDVSSPLTATDSQVAPYADNYFEYDAFGVVTKEIAAAGGCSACANGMGEFTFAYEYSGNPTYNPTFWAVKTTETLPDGNQNIVFTNAVGRTLLSVFYDTTNETKSTTYYQLDGNQRVTQIFTPSAVLGYDEGEYDLIGEYMNFGNATYLRDTVGLVLTAQLGSVASGTKATTTTPGYVEGYLASVSEQQGELGTYGSGGSSTSWTYLERDPGNGLPSTYLKATESVYDSSGLITTTYSYTFDTSDDDHRPSQITVTNPIVTTAQNGSNAATSYSYALNDLGRPTWVKDEAGFLTTVSYDPATGRASSVIFDVDSTKTTTFTSLPSGWTTPSGGGLHQTWSSTRDSHGRVSQMTDPNGAVTYFTRNDVAHEIRLYNGWNTSSNTATNPTRVIRRAPQGYTEYLTITATPAVSSGKPTGTEAISGVQSMTRFVDNTAGQTVYRDDYTTLSGTSYGTTVTRGTAGVNYLRTEFGYNTIGRPNRTKGPDGTITRTVSDGEGRVVSQWVGNHDTPTSGFWFPTNPASMVKVAEYEYDNGAVGNGNLTKAALIPGGGATNRVTTYHYDWQNRLVAVKEGEQSAEPASVNRPLTTYEYDARDQLRYVRVYDGDDITPAVTNGDLVAPLSSLLRAQSEALYDRWGRVYESRDYGVNQTTGAPTSTPTVTKSWADSRGNTVKILHPGGLVEKVKYDGLGRATATYATNGGSDTTYDHALTVTDDTVWQQQEFRYDTVGNVIQINRKDRLDSQTGTGALVNNKASGNKYTFSATGFYYDNIGRPTDVLDVTTEWAPNDAPWTRPSTVPSRSDSELVTSFLYDTGGRHYQTTDPAGVSSHTTFDMLARPLTSTEAYGTSIAFTTTASYDSGGRLLSVVAPGSRETRFGYDSFGRMNSTTERYGTAFARTTTTAFNNLGETVTSTDGLGTVARILYDDAGRPYQAHDAYGTGNVRLIGAVAYDALGRLVATDDPLTNTTEYAYDDIGRTMTVTDPLGKSWTTTYDVEGRTTKSTDPLGKQTTVAYDLLGRTTSVTDPLSHATTYKYNVDYADTVTDPLGNVTTMGFDGFGRTTSVTDALSETTYFWHDRLGNTTKVQDALGNQTSFTFDALYRTTKETDPLGKHTTYAYSSSTGDLVSITDRLGRRKEFTYDTAGRPTAEAWYSAANSLLQTQTFGYDLLDRLTAANDPDGNYTIGYNVFGEATSVNGPFGVNFTFTYDAAGNRLTAVDNKGGTTTSTYDELNRLASRSLSTTVGGMMAKFLYTDRGELAVVGRFADDAGTKFSNLTYFQYLDDGNLESISHGKTIGFSKYWSFYHYVDFEYQYDAAGRLTEKVETVNGGSGPVTTTFTLDNANQLTADGPRSFSYDGTGNRTMSGYTVTAGNRIVSDGTWTYVYDDAGQLVEKSIPTHQWTYEYDLNGQMTSAYFVQLPAEPGTAEPVPGNKIEYSYDAFGNRIRRAELSPPGGREEEWTVVSEEHYAYDGWDTAKPIPVGNEEFDAVMDLDASNNVTMRRVYGAGFDDLIARQTAGGTLNWYLTDHLGSVRMVLDANGSTTPVATADYDGFGNLLAGVPLDRYGYTGREFDSFTGLQYNRARYYDPKIGRWTSEDPIGFEAGDANLHRYVGNGVTGSVDPSGNTEFWYGADNRQYYYTKSGWTESGNRSIYLGDEIIVNHRVYIKHGNNYIPKERLEYEVRNNFNQFYGDRKYREQWYNDNAQTDFSSTNGSGWLQEGLGDLYGTHAYIRQQALDSFYDIYVEGPLLESLSALNAAKKGLTTAAFRKHLQESKAYYGKTSKVFNLQAAKWKPTNTKGYAKEYEIYQRKDIDWSRIRSNAGPKDGRGLTNAEAARKYGLAPELNDGSTVQLHHIGQDANGPLAEVSGRYHGVGKPGNSSLHGQYGNNQPHPCNPVDHKKFGNDRNEYWKWRSDNQ